MNPAQIESYATEANNRWKNRDPGQHNWQHSFSLAPGARPDRVRLTGNVARASLPEHSDWQANNPGLTSLYQHRGPNSFGTGNYELGENLRGLLASENWWQRNAQTGIGPAALRGAGAGALGGSVLGLLIGLLRGRGGQGARTGAITGGLLGAGLAGYAGYNFSKHASADQSTIRQMLSADPTISFSDKARLQQGLDGLSSADLRRLAQLLRSAGGAGVGALIAKFLLGRGKGGILAGAIIGGLVGHRSGRPGKTNAFGQRVNPGHNVLGQRM